MNSNIKHLMLWVVLIAVAGMLIFVVKNSQGPKEKELIFSDFMSEVSNKHIADANIAANDVHGKLTNGDSFHVIVPLNYPDIYNKLDASGVKTSIKDTSSGTWLSILLQASPFIVLAAFWIFMVRQMQSGGNKALSFGKSRARLHSTQQKKVTFKDVAGVEEAKEELQEIIEFLREPQKFQKLGGSHPQGRATDRASRNGQNSVGPRHRRRSQRTVLLNLGLGFRGNVRRCGRQSRPRPVRTGQEERALHHLYR